MNIVYVLLFCCTIVSIRSLERTEFKNFGTHFERNTYQDVGFDEFHLDELLTHNLTRDNYKILIKKGLKEYFAILNVIKENKRVINGLYVIDDELQFNKDNNSGGNIIIDSVRGFSAVKIETPKITAQSGNKFEVRSIFHLPQLTFSGRLADKNESFQYKWFDVSYATTEYKKVDKDFQIHPIQTSEDIYFNKVELILSNDESKGKISEAEIQQQLSNHLYDIINFTRSSTPDYWLGTDNYYLRQKKDQLMEKLLKMVVKTVETFSVVNCELSRFSFSDDKSDTNYEMVNGNLEIDVTSVQTVSKKVNDSGDVQIIFPVNGSLKYYASQLNCTNSCHFYGHKFHVTIADVSISFHNARIQNVKWSFEMKYVESLVDNRLKQHSDELFTVVLENVSKIVNEKFLVFLKSFLGPDLI